MAVFLVTSAAGAALAAPSTPCESKEQKNGQDDAAEFSRLGSAKLTLADAIGAAEQNVGGQAVNAGLEGGKGPTIFEVEVMTADGSKTVSVDGLSGAVSAVADKQDDGEGEDKD